MGYLIIVYQTKGLLNGFIMIYMILCCSIKKTTTSIDNMNIEVSTTNITPLIRSQLHPLM